MKYDIIEYNKKDSEIFIDFLNTKNDEYLNNTVPKRRVIDFLAGMTDGELNAFENSITANEDGTMSISQEGYDCENEEFEIQADEFAFKRTGVKKTDRLVEALALVAFNSYRKKKLFGNWVNIYCVMNPSVVLNSIITYLNRRFGI